MSRWGPKVYDAATAAATTAPALAATPNNNVKVAGGARPGNDSAVASDAAVTMSEQHHNFNGSAVTEGNQNGLLDSVPTTTTATTNTAADNSVPLPPDFELIDDVEWGPRVDEPGYDVDQQLMPKPRKERNGDVCACVPPTHDGDNDNGHHHHHNGSNGAARHMCCLDDSCVLYACQEECRSGCGAGPYCGNRRLQRKQFKPLTVMDAGRKGRGLRVRADCQPGDLIAEYVGQAVHVNTLPALFRRYQYDRQLYIMALGENVYLDARAKGGLARFINHSCAPNCKVERWKVRGVLRAAVLALENIPAGTELSFDYQWERKRGRAPTKCHCGAPNCRGTLEVSKSLEESQLQHQLSGHWKKLQSTPDQTVVNRTIQVYSREHDEYFLAEVTGYNAATKQHCVLYRHDMNEAWEDLSREDWMILDEAVDKEHFIIAKKTWRGDTNNNNNNQESVSHLIAPPTHVTKHYLYVQTPIKDAFWNRHLMERCERNCQVRVTATPHMRPPLPCNQLDSEDVEKYAALDASQDGTVWKLSITGTDVARALSILQKNVVHLEKKLQEEARKASPPPPVAATGVWSENGVSGVATTTTATVHDEVIFPRVIADALKLRLSALREKLRTVTLTIAPSESKSKQFGRLLLEGHLPSDVTTARTALWSILLHLCAELGAPETVDEPHMYHHLGYLGGELTARQFYLLRDNRHVPLPAQHVRRGSNKLGENLRAVTAAPFIRSFERTYRCKLWIQAIADRGRVNSSNQVVGEATDESARKVYIGGDPNEVSTRWAQVQSRALELERGVRFYFLGLDRMFQQLMNKTRFFDFVQYVTGAVVGMDNLTGDHLRLDGRVPVHASLSADAQSLTEAERAALAEEMVRLQVELYRDRCIRESSWIYGRDWALATQVSAPLPSTGPTLSPDSKTASLSFGLLDVKSACQGCVEIPEIVAHLEMEGKVAAHAAIIMYRFVTVALSSSQLKVREVAQACVFLANKCQKLVKWKKLEQVLEAGYKTYYPGTPFDRAKEDIAVLEEKVLAAEKEILETLNYDVFMRDIEWITLATHKKVKSVVVKSIFDFAFSGQVLGAGPSVWLRFDVDYIFAACAGLLKVPLDTLIPALGLIPFKVAQVGERLAECIKYGRPTSSKMACNPMLEHRSTLEKQLERVKSTCNDLMKSGIAAEAPGAIPGATSVIEQRYKIIGDRSSLRHVIEAVPTANIVASLVPMASSVTAETGAVILLGPSSRPNHDDVVLEGSWRSVAAAEKMVRSIVNAPLGPAVIKKDTMFDSLKGQAKAHVQLLSSDDIVAAEGWEGTGAVHDASSSPSSKAKVGSTNCIAAKTKAASLKAAGLRWWTPARIPSSPSGAVNEFVNVRANPCSPIEGVAQIAQYIANDSTDYPLLTARANATESEEMVAISLQRWPPVKVEKREEHIVKKSKSKGMGAGFSAGALQEMQLLIQLHSLIPAAHGHPNFALPITIAAFADEESQTESAMAKPDENIKTLSNGLLLEDDPMLSLFGQKQSNARADKKNKRVRDCPHLTFDPAPFALSRFIAPKRDGSQDPLPPSIVAAWFHDLLSALVHCHSNHIILRTIQPDQIVVDQSGIVKIAGLYRATCLPHGERRKAPKALASAKAAQADVKRKRKSKRGHRKDDDDDFSGNKHTAPEILLGSPKHTKHSDVFAMGSILASILLNRNIFTGKDRDSLLNSIYHIVGTPATDNYNDAAGFPHYIKPAKKYPRGQEIAFEKRLDSKYSKYEKAVSLLGKMLQLGPEERCTADEALAHEFLEEYREHSQTEAYRLSFVADWTDLKRRLMHNNGSERPAATTDSAKRKAMLMAAAGGSDTDDDLYDMDDLLGPEKKQRVEA